MSSPRTLGVVLFPGFEVLDVFGPLEIFGNMRAREHFRTCTVAATSGPVESAQVARAVADHGFDDAPTLDMLLVPGGIGTRTEVDNAALLDWLRRRAATAEIVMSVCTGAALLARAGLLDGLKATTNKFAFHWVASQGPNVDWVRQARWVDAGKFVTSSGVTAGIDMSLAVVARLHGTELAEMLATFAEHEWHRDPGWDPFAKVHGLV
jgi:transcriptional regulator GlxA family with amidase domain